MRSQGIDQDLLGFFDYALGQYLARKKTNCKLVISHGHLEVNLHVEGTTGKFLGVTGFDRAVLTTRALDFDVLFDIDEQLLQSVMTDYCRALRIPEFFEEVKLHRTLRLFAELVAASKREDAEAVAIVLKKIIHMKRIL